MEGNVIHSKQELIVEDPDQGFPAVPLELLEALERRFPDRSPAITMADREIWAAHGRASVVRFLREMYSRPKI